MFSVTHIRLTGNISEAKTLVGFARKRMGRLKKLMSFQGLNSYSLPDFTTPDGSVVRVFSLEGVRDYIEIFAPSNAVIVKEEELVDIEIKGRMLLFYGMEYEKINVEYAENSSLFLSDEAVVCEDGAGHVDIVIENDLLGNYSRCWDAGTYIRGLKSSANGLIKECQSRVYDKTYETYEITAPFKLQETDSTKSPVDFRYFSCRVNAKDKGKSVWSKTVDELTVTAYEYSVIAEPGWNAILNWGIAAKYKGTQIVFPLNTNKGFSRNEAYTSNGLVNYRNLTVMFDCWVEELEDGTKEYYIGGAAYNDLWLWKIQEDFTATLKVIPFTGRAYKNLFDSNDDTIYIADPVGYYENYIFFHCGNYIQVEELDLKKGVTLSVNILHLPGIKYGQDEEDGVCEIRDYIWNHYNNKLYVFYRGQDETTNSDDSYYVAFGYITCYLTGVWSICYYDESGSPYDCDGWICDSTFSTCPPFIGWQTVSGSKDQYEWEVDISLRTSDQIGNINDFWNTYHYLYVDTNKTKIDYGNHYIAGFNPSGGKIFKNFDSGELETRTESKSLITNGAYDIGLSSKIVCDSEKFTYVLNNWIFTPTGVAYNLTSTSSNPCLVTEEELAAYEPEIKEIVSGRNYLAMEDWEALLKQGEDSAQEEILSKLIIYSDLDTMNLFIAGDMPFTYLGDGQRAFFQYEETIVESLTGIEEIE